MSFGVIAALFIIVMITIYIIVDVIYKPKDKQMDVVPSIMPLYKSADVLMANDVNKMLLNNNGSTVIGLFKFLSGDRTSKYNTNYIPFLQIKGVWSLEISNSPNNKEQAAARLNITISDTITEIVELPPIPKQKWVCIALLREGRRFDVIYDNKMAASKRLEHYPKTTTSSPLSVGFEGLDGKVVHVIANSTRLSPAEVERIRISYVDTNNTVPEENKINMSLPVTAINIVTQCPSGLPCEPVTKPPTNQLLRWDTPYA